MEAVILVVAFLLAFTLALVRSFEFLPTKLSDSELRRRAEAGDTEAAYELYRRPLFPALTSLKTLKAIVLAAALTTLLVATHEWWVGLLLTLGFLLLAELAIAKNWLHGLAAALQRTVEPGVLRAARIGHAVLRHIAPYPSAPHEPVVGSRQELISIITRSGHMLGDAEKSRLQGAIAFGELKIVDVMVPRDKIATADISETVGPVLLDRLHKAGHNIIVVVKKDLDHIAGLLYMTDAASGHPEIKTVKDAVRPSVYYLSVDEPLEAVLSAALMTGRQLFMVTDSKGKTQGLITLGDALARLNGKPIPKDAPVSKTPKK